jgi:hypothetical protein
MSSDERCGWRSHSGEEWGVYCRLTSRQCKWCRNSGPPAVFSAACCRYLRTGCVHLQRFVYRTGEGKARARKHPKLDGLMLKYLFSHSSRLPAAGQVPDVLLCFFGWAGLGLQWRLEGRRRQSLPASVAASASGKHPVQWRRSANESPRPVTHP